MWSLLIAAIFKMQIRLPVCVYCLIMLEKLRNKVTQNLLDCPSLKYL